MPAYLGPSGWVGVDLDTDTDWTEIAELLDASYRLTAPQAQHRAARRAGLTRAAARARSSGHRSSR